MTTAEHVSNSIDEEPKPYVYRTLTEHESIFLSTQNSSRTEPSSSRNPNWTRTQYFGFFPISKSEMSNRFGFYCRRRRSRQWWQTQPL